MRIKQAERNIRYSLIIYALNNILKFIVRVVFVKCLPVEYLGINGLFSNVLALLTLAELGVGQSIVYSLYKSLASDDTETVKLLMKLFKKAYIAIGCFIIAAGFFMIPWLEWFIKDNNISNLRLFYVIFLLNTGISYFYAYKRDIIIADQKQYINSIYQGIGQIILAVFQVVSLVVYESYLIYIALMLVITMCENWMVARKADKLYPYLRESAAGCLSSDIYLKIKQNIKSMVGHRLGSVFVTSSPNIILSKFIGLSAIAVYSNYFLVISAVNNLANQFFASITAGIGNLIVLESSQKKAYIFKVIEFIVAWQAMIVSCSFYVLLNPLIEVWLGKQFLFDSVIVRCLIVNFYLMYMRKAVLAFRDASGLYWNDRYKPLAEAVINLVASVYLTVHYGVIGVIWGGIISTLLTCFWVEPYVLFGNSIDIRLKDYFKDYFKYAVVTLLTAVFSKWLYNQLFSEVTVINFILGVILCLIISNAVWILVFRKREEMAYLRNVARDKFGMKFLK